MHEEGGCYWSEPKESDKWDREPSSHNKKVKFAIEDGWISRTAAYTVATSQALAADLQELI